MSITVHVARPYQAKGKDQIRDHFRRGIRRVLLWLATGGGKTFVFCDIAKESAYKGKRVVVMVRGRKLVDQASKRLFREGVHHGVLMASHWNYRPQAPIQICSIDTLIARKHVRPPADLIIIDEAHMAVSKGYKEVLSEYPDAYVLAVTATPYTDEPLRHLAEVIVKPTSVSELIALGFLVDARYFAPHDPDLSGVRVSKSTHDYMADDLAEAMQSGGLTGDIVNHWIKLAEGRPTLCFASNVAHSKNLVEQFLSQGVAAEHCDADTPEPIREEIIKRLESGATKVVSNVGIFCTGVDIPCLGCIVMARPTKSRILYIQQLGRGTRPFEGKDDFLVLDHTGNVKKHGFITDEPDANLDGKLTAKAKSPRTCDDCYAAFFGTVCPHCGKDYKIAEDTRGRKEIVVVEGELVELEKTTPEERQHRIMTKTVQLLVARAEERGYKKNWVHYKLRDKYGQEAADRYYPYRGNVLFRQALESPHGAVQPDHRAAFDESDLSRMEVGERSR